ncbi:MAG: hypothetical protein QXF46_01530 [Thermofilaceae archaeon]
MRRKGGVPPMVTVLVTIASIVAAALVSWFLYAAARSAVQQPLVEVTAAYAVGSGTSWRVMVNLRNVGSVDLSNVAATLEVAAGSITLSCSPNTLSKGQSATCSGTTTTIQLSDGMSAVVTVQGTDPSGSQHRIPLGAKITVP